TGKVVVIGENSQAHLRAGGTYPNDFEIEGNGWDNGGNRHGALHFGDGGTNGTGTIQGDVTLTGNARIGATAGSTGILAGTLAGDDLLEINATSPEDLSGTIVLDGDATSFTGDTTVAGGRLYIRGNFGGNVDVWGGAALGGTGSLLENLVIGDDTTPSDLHVDGSSATPFAIAGDVQIFGTTRLVPAGFPASPATSFTASTYGSLTGDVSDLVPTGLRGANVTDDSANSRVVVNFPPAEIA